MFGTKPGRISHCTGDTCRKKVRSSAKLRTAEAAVELGAVKEEPDGGRGHRSALICRPRRPRRQQHQHLQQQQQ
jgi:hypothetical protein